jgi:hypothetical protein
VRELLFLSCEQYKRDESRTNRESSMHKV